jgi:23S rRNA (cytidine1920-2'-O)/16S rRNA (cytidine1409-2'-O)-methyltransferase
MESYQKSKKIRLDQQVVEQGLAQSRTQAQALILAGKILDSKGQALTKAGHLLPPDTELQLKEKLHPWVSRGGMKLMQALVEFNIQPEGQIIADIGASTGGFTDVLLQHMAAKIYAVDVGYGQLADKLRRDARVVVMEKTNARYLDAEQIPDPLDAVVCDASFISLKTVLPAALALVKAGGWLVALIKPQFEVGRAEVGNGVITDTLLHARVCNEIRDWLNQLTPWQVQGIHISPILGPKGNTEFLIYARKG